MAFTVATGYVMELRNDVALVTATRLSFPESVTVLSDVIVWLSTPAKARPPDRLVTPFVMSIVPLVPAATACVALNSIDMVFVPFPDRLIRLGVDGTDVVKLA